jgi:nucleotide-binding universal stress UspA family protein
MFKNILFSYDGSEHSRRAAPIAGDLARQQADAVLWIVCVVEPASGELGEPYLSQLIEIRTLAGQKLIQEAVDLVGQDIQIRRELLFGAPADSILNVAETRQCDLIVMGTRGLSPWQGLLLGSQTLKVISLSNCPVMTVK